MYKRVYSIGILCLITLFVSSMFASKKLHRRAFYAVRDVKAFVSNMSVIGCGLMGSGIAAVSAGSGYNVKVLGVDDYQLRKSEEKILRILSRLSKNKPSNFMGSAKSRINFTTDINNAVSNSEMIIEAISEDLKAKCRLLK